nr:immunoglobulin light chain junction region [Macaca mulatta]MOW04609.1 immunoglobulin light chain junction region [Macaca mulatta]MOW04676.1 immunoglobulin light chain junction region [Macaca mulatta]MOW05195.1 immunoglobulin light chain junction region [Macaca mulatta]MOW05631.1 immunoglobulin light chain junction region [Macaca mulatta]
DYYCVIWHNNAYWIF